MGFINSLLRKFEDLDLEMAAEDAVEVTLDDVIEAQQRQIKDGYASDGDPIGDGRYNSRGYFFHKQTLPTYNPIAGEIDLYLTGKFSRMITASIIGDELVIESADPKAPDVVGPYGGTDVIFGLTDMYKVAYVNESLAPLYFYEIRKQVGLSTAL